MTALPYPADDPGARGRLTIRSRAAGRIAELAALEVPGVVRRTTRLGSLTGRDLPRAVVDLSPEQPNIRLDIALAWPSQVAALCFQVREQVATELRRHTGRLPSRVDIAVAELVVEPENPRPAKADEDKT